MTRRFARSRDAEPVMREIVKTNKSCHQTPIISFAVRVDVAEFARSAQMRVFRQRPKSYLVMRRCQAFATLCTASLQDQTTVLGRHPRAKSMRLCPSAIVRLKSAFRHSCLFSTQKKSVRLTAHTVSVKKAGLIVCLSTQFFSVSEQPLESVNKAFELNLACLSNTLGVQKYNLPLLKAIKMSVLKPSYC